MNFTLGLGLLSATNLLLVFAAQAYILMALGAGSSTDAFFASMIVPQLVAGILATPLVGALLPQLAGEPDETIRRRGWTTLRAAAVTLGGAALIVGLLSPLWIAAVLPGFPPETRRLTVELTAIQMLGMIFTAFLAVVSCASQAKRRFIAVEGAELVSNGLALAALGMLLSRRGIAAAAWIYAARPLVATLLLLPILGRYLPGSPEDPFLKSLWRRLKAPILGTAYNKLGFVVDRLLSSLVPAAGALSLFHFGDKLYAAGVDIVRSAIVTPAVPLLTEHAKAGRWSLFRSASRRRLAAIGAITWLVAVILFVAGKPALELLAGPGALTREDSGFLWSLLVALDGQLIAGSLAVFLAYAFYATGDTGTPTRVTMAATTLGIAFKIIAFSSWGLIGVAAGTSLLQCFNAIALFLLLRTRLRAPEGRPS